MKFKKTYIPSVLHLLQAAKKSFSILAFFSLSLILPPYNINNELEAQAGQFDFLYNPNRELKDSEVDQRLVSINKALGEFFGLRHPRSVEGSRSFFKVWRSFSTDVDLSRISELTNTEFEKMLLQSVPSHLRSEMERFLPLALNLSEKYQVDPFWVLAVMWTESHFNPRAKSMKEAQGLMQIMPETGRFIARMLYYQVSLKAVKGMAWVPTLNVEMGVFYLRKLVRMFHHNYVLATVSYNMGPYAVKSWPLEQRMSAHNHAYVEKVRKSYEMLSSTYKQYLRKVPRASLSTYVLKSKLAKSFPSAEQVLNLSNLPDARRILFASTSF